MSKAKTLLPAWAQINDVALRANDVLRNKVMLRINDVATSSQTVSQEFNLILYSIYFVLPFQNRRVSTERVDFTFTFSFFIIIILLILAEGRSDCE